jgi:hypothetical protein
MKKLKEKKAKRKKTGKCRLLTSAQPHSRPVRTVVTSSLTLRRDPQPKL